MKQDRLSGKRYVNLVRCSTDQQADTSPVDQQKVLDLFAREHGMIHAGDDIVLEGVSASRPGARTDMEGVLARKREQDDFDVLLVQDISRLTRAGSDHAGKLKYDLEAAGVEIVFASQVSTGDPALDALMQSFNAHSAQQQVKSMSYAIVRGQTSSLEAGKIPHSFRVPFGVDRLYLGPDGTPRHRIRNLADGSQQMLAPDTDEVIACYPPNPKRGESVHYKRQYDERIVLVPGDPQRVSIVRQIYRRSLIDGWGTYRIALELNDLGARSADGGPWNQRSVKIILENPTYSGTGIASRYATGLYNVRGTEAAPAAVDLDTHRVAKQRRYSVRPRPEREWRVQDYALLADYLGTELAARAKEHHTRVLVKSAEKAQRPRAKAKPGGDRHADSPYLLKGLLHSRQGDHPMTGKRVGPKNGRRRYYVVTRGAATPSSDSALSRMIPAEPLERVVLAAVREALLDLPNLRAVITTQAKQQQAAADSAGPVDLAALKSERLEIASRLKDALMLGASSRKLMQSQFDQWESRLANLERLIVTVEAAATPQKLDVEATVAKVASRLKNMAEGFEGLTPALMRQFLGSLVSKLSVDLESREVEMEMALPHDAAVFGGDRAPLCVVGTNYKGRVDEAQRTGGVKIAVWRCVGERDKSGKPCFACSRRAA